MPIGVVKRFDPNRGYGFIRPVESGDHPDVFFHVTNVECDTDDILGARVGYQLAPSRAASARANPDDPRKQTMAVNVRYV